MGREVGFSLELGYKDQRNIIGKMCEHGQWQESIDLINQQYGFNISQEYIEATAGIYEKRLSKNKRFARSGGPIMFERDKGSSASHSVQVLLLAGWIFSKVEVSQEFKTRIGEMVLVHELGESFGELSTAGNRTSGVENGRARTIRKLQRELISDDRPEAKVVYEKVAGYISDNVLDETERGDLEADIGAYVARKDVGGELAEIMIQRQKQTEEDSYIAKVHKLIERLETKKQWIDKIKGVRQSEEKYIVGSIKYISKILQTVLQYESESKNPVLEGKLSQLVAGVIFGIRCRANYDVTIES